MTILDVTFEHHGQVEQSIEIFNDESKEVFLEKLKSGAYCITDAGNGIRKTTGDFKTVGLIVNQRLIGDIEFETNDED